jgi:glutamyl-tRNA reductase
MAFEDIKSSLVELCSMANVDECVILQTCNRTELCLVSKDGEGTAKKISDYLTKRCGDKSGAAEVFEVSLNQDALKHLLSVASGLESMVVGEDQILGQVWNAYLKADSAATAGSVLKTVFTRAVSVGRRVRNETEINRGAVSIGSVAVELAETVLGDLDGKNVLVIGAGEIGTLVAKALARCRPNAIFIANRTYERAVKLAEELKGKAVKFSRLEEVLKDADVVICSTAAPHYLLKKEPVCSIMKQRSNHSGLMRALLAQGVHTKYEIPEILKEKQEELGLDAQGIEVIYGEPLSSDERIAEIIEEKALKALGQESDEVLKVQEASKLSASTNMYETSMKIIRPLIEDALEKAPEAHAPVIERVVHTTADPEFAKLVVIHEEAVEAGVAAIKAGAKIIADVKMVKAGINKTRVKRFGGQILTYVDDERAINLAKKESITRSAAAMRLAIKDCIDNSIIAIGNAPTAAFELAKAVNQGVVKPALVIAAPVGYVGAADSKEEVAALPVPHVIIRGPKGGSALAVVVFNALLGLAEKDAGI